MIDYKLIDRAYTQRNQEAIELQHHAAQYISLAGKYLIRKEEDDSNTNMQYIPDKNMLLGNFLPNSIRIGLRLSDLNLCLVQTDYSCSKEIPVIGKTRVLVQEELKQALSSTGIDTSGFNNKLHYKMPSHKVLNGEKFALKYPEQLEDTSIMRSNAHFALEKVLELLGNIPDIRVWPHHFDSGTIIPLGKNSTGSLTSSIGIGWAIPDSMASEPYFYLSYWRKDGAIDLSELESPEGSQWLVKEWNGAILRHSELIKFQKSDDQIKLIQNFYMSGIKVLQSQNKSQV
ncbi:MAG: hypothetical protein QNK33_01060 [Bacteroidales bacterium]|nr:hypothetical protein [Bacteroidales bacterium]